MPTKVHVVKNFNPQWPDILGQTSKCTMIGVDNWCNIFDVPDFLSSINDDFFYHRNGLWNLLNWKIIGILVLGLPVQFNWTSKKL